MIFYFAPRTVAVASHITLEEVRADYETRVLDFSAGEQRSDAYLGINPKGRVPALVTDEGVITETPAILLYLAQRYPDSNLAPTKDAFQMAKLQEFNAYLCATVHVAHAHRVRGERWADDENALQGNAAESPANNASVFSIDR